MLDLHTLKLASEKLEVLLVVLDAIDKATQAIETITPNFTNLDNVAENIDNVNSVADNESNINAIVSEVIPNMEQILSSAENIDIAVQKAAIATAKAEEASQSASTASTKADEASQSATTATDESAIATSRAGEASQSAEEAEIAASIATEKAQSVLNIYGSTTLMNNAVITATNKAIEASDSALSALTSKNAAKLSQDNAALSAAMANEKANISASVVVPTTATYNYTTQDWRGSMMSKAQFNALASERRVNRAGSGADEFGKGNATTALNVNEGIHTSTTTPNTFYLGKVGGVGTSKTDAYIASINGSIITCKYLNTTTADATILLPDAPTIYPYNLVMPYGTILTQAQIDAGWTVSVDLGNHGLITQGMGAFNGFLWFCTDFFSINSGIVSFSGSIYHNFLTEVGKTYTFTFKSQTSGGTTTVDASTYHPTNPDYGTPLCTQLVLSNTSYTESTILFTATSSASTIRLTLSGASSNIKDFVVFKNGATLTAEQIASGVIKHADASNSGLIVNGNFDTDTSGWTAVNSTISVVAGELKVANSIATSGYTYTTFNTIIGKKYIMEFDAYRGDSSSYTVEIAGVSGTTFTGVNTVKSRATITFIATATTHIVRFFTNQAVIGRYCLYDNITLFPADAISRSDLVFLESWHEDVSEKDFVYPLGNVQYLGTTGDSGTPVVGAFAGSATYSLFSDTWQADGALVGKGYVWSTLSDANKKAFVANAENNCYLDGDKVIQVRYRMRVIQGLGDSWGNSIYPNSYINKFGYISDTLPIKAKGKLTFEFDIDGTAYPHYVGTLSSKVNTNLNLDVGIFGATASSGGTRALTVAYEGYCFALPIALVHRRNQGGYNATYNPNGTKAMTVTPTSIADCFNIANLITATGYIGTSTPRPDGLFYDQVSVEDFKPSNKGADLRNFSKKRTAQSIIEEFAPKALASTIPYYNNDTTALTTYKDTMEVRDTSGNRYPLISKVGNVVTIGATVANKKGFSIVTQNGKQYLQVADDVASDATVQMNLSTVKYDIGVFDA